MTKTILIVDDSSTLRQAVRLTLERASFSVIESCDGEAALNKLNGQSIDLIISDIHMPNMDGISFVKAVKRHALYAYTPIMMFTTESNENIKREGREAGAKGWLLKPFHSGRLLDAVQRLVAP